MKVTKNCTYGGTPCECRTFYGGMGSETHVYVTEDGKVLGCEVIDGEWTILDADEAREEYEYLTSKEG